MQEHGFPSDSDADLQATLNLAVQRSLPRLAAGLSLVFLIFGVAHLSQGDPSQGHTTLAALCATTAAVLLALQFAVGKWTVPAEHVHLIAALVAGLILVNCAASMHVLRDMRQTVNFLLLIIASGAVFVSIPWLIAVVAASTLAWAGVSWFLDDADFMWTHHLAAVVSASALSLIIARSRIDAGKQAERNRRVERAQRQELSQAVAALEREVEERRRSEQNAKESEDRYRQLVEMCPDAIAVHDGNEWLYSNRAGARWVGNPDFDRIMEIPVADSNIEDAAPNEIGVGAQSRTFSNFSLTDEGGRRFNLEVASVPVTFRGAPANQVLLRDVTLIRKAADELAWRLALARALNKVSTELASLPLHEIDAGLMRGFERIAPLFGAERLYLAQVGQDGGAPPRLVEWPGAPTPVRVDRLSSTTISTALPWASAVLARGAVIATSIDALPADASLERRFFSDPPAAAAVLAPIRMKNTLAGCLGIEWARSNMMPGEESLELLAVLAEIISHTIDQKQTECEIKNRESLFRCMVEQSFVGIDIVQDNRVRYANPKLAEIFGYTVEEIVATSSISDFIFEADRPLVVENIRRRIDGTEPKHVYTFRGLRKDGRIIQAEVHGSRAEYEGRPAAVGVILDVTQRKRMEEAIRASEARFKTLFEEADIGIVLISAEGRSLGTNPGLARILGYTAEELAALPFSSLIHPDDQPGQAALAEELRSGKRNAFRSEVRLTRKGGTRIWTHLTMAAIRSPKGRTEACVGMIEDITEKKVNEIWLRESEARVQAIIENASDGIVTMDADGVIESVNTAATTIFGYSSQELVGKRFDALVTIEGNAGFIQTVLGRTAGESPTPFGERHEVEGLKKGGSVLSLDVSISEIRVEERRHYSVIVRDNTDRKRLEDRLVQSQKMEAIGTLAAGIAHDFNNVLASIIGYSELALSDAPPGSELESCLQNVYQAGQQATRLVRQLLSFSRRQDEYRQPIQVAVVAKEMVKLLRPSLPAGVEIETTIDPDSGTVQADATHLHQILANLCSNAIDAMREKGGTLGVDVRDVEVVDGPEATRLGIAPGGYLRISIRDTGRGIDPETRLRIFEPYFTTKGVGEGSGMGLSVAHGLVASMKGAIDVASEPGQGSTFDVYLPRIEAEKKSEPARIGALSRGSERILVVDDEPAIVEMTTQALESLGYNVESTVSSLEALERVKANPSGYDLIVSDQNMPQLTGLALINEIRAIRPEIRAIITTGHSEQVSEATAETREIDGFIRKPASLKDLALLIRDVLDRPRSANSP